MEETNPIEVAVIIAMAIVLTLVPILVLKGRARRRWRAAAAPTGLPLVHAARIEKLVPGGELVAQEDSRPVYWGPASGLQDQVVTSVLGVLRDEPPEAFVVSTDGSPLGGPTFSTGDAEFDQAIVVGAKDSEAGCAYLTPRRRAALRKFFVALPEGALSAGRIGRVHDGRMGTKELIRTLVAVKDALDGLSDSTPAGA